MLVPTQVTAPLSAPVPAHTALSHPPATRATSTQSTTFAQGAVRAAGLPTFEQEQLLQQNGAMGSIVASTASTQS
jgi:hypothetical protein